jgi:prevent-host-death family protein
MVSTTVQPITILKTKSAQLVRKARDSGAPVIITQNGKATAVLQDVESFDRQRKALLLLKLFAQGDREIREGQGIRHDQAIIHFEQRLKALK